MRNCAQKRPPPPAGVASNLDENAAISAVFQPKIAPFAANDRPTNTLKSQTSDSDSTSSQDGCVEKLKLKIPKSSKNPPVASKKPALKPNFRRRRALLATEPSDGKQRLLSEFLRDGLVAANEGRTSEDGAL